MIFSSRNDQTGYCPRMIRQGTVSVRFLNKMKFDIVNGVDGGTVSR